MLSAGFHETVDLCLTDPVFLALALFVSPPLPQGGRLLCESDRPQSQFDVGGSRPFSHFAVPLGPLAGRFPHTKRNIPIPPSQKPFSLSFILMFHLFRFKKKKDYDGGRVWRVCAFCKWRKRTGRPK